MKRGEFLCLFMWIMGLMVVFSAILSISVLETSTDIKLLVLLNIATILFVLMHSVQVLVQVSEGKED